MAIQPRPQEVKIAVLLLWLSLAASIAGLCAWLYVSGLPIHVGTLLTLSKPLVGFLVSAVLIHAISTRRNWARLIFALFLAAAILMTSLSVVLDRDHFPWLVAMDVALVLIQAYATYLLFTRASNGWFRQSTAAT